MTTVFFLNLLGVGVIAAALLWLVYQKVIKRAPLATVAPPIVYALLVAMGTQVAGLLLSN